LADTLAAQAVNTPEMMQNLEVRWYCGKQVVSHAQDECTIGTWIFARSPFSLVGCCLPNAIKTSDGFYLDRTTNNRENT